LAYSILTFFGITALFSPSDFSTRSIIFRTKTVQCQAKIARRTRCETAAYPISLPKNFGLYTRLNLTATPGENVRVSTQLLRIWGFLFRTVLYSLLLLLLLLLLGLYYYYHAKPKVILVLKETLQATAV